MQRRGGRLTTLLLQRFPAVDEMTLQQLQARLAAADVGPGRLTYGDERVLDFLDSASRRLLRPDLIRRHPELAPLGFFLRRSQLARWLSTADQSGTLRVPRGMVFHVPPSNGKTAQIWIGDTRNMPNCSGRQRLAALRVLAQNRPAVHAA